MLPELPPQIPAAPDEALDDGLKKFKLNASQQTAVVDCVSAMGQDMPYWVRLIWGPPGTGKTKTIVSLLWSMMMKNHRTLACAPTNTAVLEVASRLLGLIDDGHFSLGDVVLLGNDDGVRGNLADMFLEQRLSRLKCTEDWRHHVSCMVGLLEKPLTEHSSYLRSVRTGIMNCLNSMRQEEENVTFKDFFVENYEFYEECLHSCLETYREDLPWCAASVESFRLMDEVLHALEGFRKLMLFDPKQRLARKLFFKNRPVGYWPEFEEAKALCLDKLKHLLDHFDIPSSYEKFEEYILNNAKVIVCTACSSSHLSQHGKLLKFRPLDLLVVDEAAQLRECELLIPLQTGIRRAVLIGDKCQLPALVKSKVILLPDEHEFA